MSEQYQEPKKKNNCLKGCLIVLAVFALIFILLISILIFKGKDIGLYFMNRFESNIAGDLADIPIPEGMEKAYSPFIFLGLQKDVNVNAFRSKELEIDPMEYFLEYFSKEGWELLRDKTDEAVSEEQALPVDAFGIIFMEKGDKNLAILKWSDEGQHYINIIKGPKELIEEQVREHSSF